MNCKEFRTMAVELAKDTYSDCLKTSEALAHATACADCRSRLAEERILTIQLHQAAESMRECHIPVRVDSAVFHAFERHRRNLGTSSRSVRGESQGRRKHVWVSAGAAAAVAALTLLIWTKPGSDELQAPRSTATNVTLPSEPDTTVQSNGETEDAIRRVAPVASRVQVSPAAERTEEPTATNSESAAEISETINQFIPIPLGVNPARRGFGPIVRVEVSGALLDSLGFPVSGDLYGKRIRADLMLGDDGMAQAIRFVEK